MNLLKLGQGPRPDLLDEELKLKDLANKRFENADGLFVGRPSTNSENKDVQKKDIFAMIIALFQVLLPWILGGIFIFFLFIFLITRID